MHFICAQYGLSGNAPVFSRERVARESALHWMYGIEENHRTLLIAEKAFYGGPGGDWC